MQNVTGVVVQNGEITVVDDLKVKDPAANEVTVRVLASGICRSDLALLHDPSPHAVVMGHEASGVVERVGSEVTDLEEGQLVAVTCQRPCQQCEACAKGLYSACPASMSAAVVPFTRRGEPVASFARSSSMATRIVVDRMQVHPVHGIAPGPAALIGCAVSTGYGTARNVAKVTTGDVVVVIGVGGIGINSIQTARILGAKRIIAVDVNAGKETMARQFGADEFFLISPGQSADEIAESLQSRIGSTVDVVVDCTGQPSVVAAGLKIMSMGGRLGLVGLAATGVMAELDINDVMYRHIQISGAMNGGCNPYTDFTQILQLAEQGRLNLADQVTHHFPLEQAADALEMMQSGEALRVVLEMPA